MAGAGGRTQLGGRHGSRGVIRAIIVDGRRCRHTRPINRASGSFFKAAPSASGLDFGLNAGEFTFVRTRTFVIRIPANAVSDREKWDSFTTTPRSSITSMFVITTSVNRGIDPEHITAVTRTPIHQVEIRETTTHVPRGGQFTRG